MDNNCYYKYPEKILLRWKPKSFKSFKKEKNSTTNKLLFNLNKYNLNYMFFSYITYKNKNLEHYTNFKTITNILSSTVNILKNI